MLKIYSYPVQSDPLLCIAVSIILVQPLTGNKKTSKYNRSSILKLNNRNEGKLLEEHIVLIGAHGWNHPGWEEDFYPDDLPEDWRLAYYGNEFQIVVVPASYWQAGTQTVTGWLDETDDSPRFICEWSAEIDNQDKAEQVLQCIALLNERVDGVVFSVQDMPDELLLDNFRKLIARYAVSVDIQSGDRETILARFRAAAAGSEFGVCWHGEADRVSDLDAGTLAIARIDNRDLTPKELRYLLECCIAASNAERRVALIFYGSPPDLKQLVNAGVILDLL